MAEPNYYALFGVSPSATAEQLRLAFRKAILEHHPDRNGGKSSSQEWTILLKEAYDVLSDPVERSRYDARLRNAQQSTAGPAVPPYERPNPSAPPPYSTPPNTGQQWEQTEYSQENFHQETGWEDVEGFACARCGVLNETLRVCVFRSVTSLIYFTRTELVQPGIHCAPCRLRHGLKWSLQCFVMGWWGFPFGVGWTIAALINNLRGGVQSRAQNASLLECVGAILLGQKMYSEAVYALSECLKLDAKRPEAQRFLAEAVKHPEVPRPRPPRTIKQRLNHLPPAAYALPVFLLMAVSLLNLGGANTDNAQGAQLASPAGTSHPAPPKPLEKRLDFSAFRPDDVEPISLPNGTVLKRWPSAAPCYLTVDNGNDRDAIVKLCIGKSLRYAMYVRANATANLYHIEPATYNLKYSIGVDADKQNRRFRGDHDNSRADNPITFSIEQKDDGPRYSYEEITLHPVTNGNMPFTPAGDDDFDTDTDSQLLSGQDSLSLANAAFDRKDWAQAESYYTQAIAAGIDTPDLRTDLGTAYRELKQPQKALEQYVAAQKQDPQQENSLLNEGIVYAYDLNEPTKAAKIWQSYLARFPHGRHNADVKELLSSLQQ